jgi:FtsZ-binding cell division protein ZapB
MTQERIDKHDEVLTELRVTVARLDERTRSMDKKLDEAVLARDELEKQIQPVVESMNRWKGGFAMIAIVAGTTGAAITTFLKKLLGIGAIH